MECRTFHVRSEDFEGEGAWFWVSQHPKGVRWCYPPEKFWKTYMRFGTLYCICCITIINFFVFSRFFFLFSLSSLFICKQGRGAPPGPPGCATETFTNGIVCETDEAINQMREATFDLVASNPHPSTSDFKDRLLRVPVTTIRFWTSYTRMLPVRFQSGTICTVSRISTLYT